MTDLRQMSDADLMRALGSAPPSPVRAASTMSDVELLQALGRSPSPQRPSTAADVAKSAGVGLGEGLIGLAGFRDDAQSMARSGVAWLGDQTVGRAYNLATRGVNEPTQGAREVARQQNAQLNPMTSANIRNRVEGVTGPFYEPQTVPGQYARTISRNVPAAAIGPGGVAGRTAMAVIPGVAEEMAGQLTANTWAEPYARTSAAVAAGLGTAAAGRAMASRSAQRAIIEGAPTREAMENLGSRLYQQADEMGIQFSPQEFRRAAENMTITAAREGIDPVTTPKAAAVLGRVQDAAGLPRVAGTIDAARLQANATPSQLSNYANDAIAPSLRDVETLRRVASGATVSADRGERRLIRQMVSGLDDFVENPGIIGAASSNADEAGRILREARQTWAAAQRGNVIDEAARRAEVRAGSAGTGGNIDNAMRQQLRRVEETPRLSAGFTPSERELMRQAVVGTPGQNALRQIGRFAPTGVVSTGLSSGMGAGAGGAIGMALGGPALAPVGAAVGAGALMGVGQAAKNAADGITRNRLELIGAMTRARSPAASPELQRLIASDPFGNAARVARIRALLLGSQIVEPVQTPSNR